MSKVLTPVFRVSYPNVFKPKHNDLSGKDEYSLVALFPKGADLTPLKKAAEEAVIKKWGENKAKWPKKLKLPFRDQADREKEDENTGKKFLPPGYEAGAVYMNLKSSQRPGVVNQKVEDIIEESEFYAGCWARATINAYAYDQAGNQGVAFGLGNIQKVKEGDPFGGRTKATDDFAPIAGAEAGTTASDLFG